MENYEKGLVYEKYIRDYLIKDGVECYLWSETPETLLIEKNIIGSHNEARLIRKENKNNPLRDTGVDLVLSHDNKISFIQCKNGYDNGITYGNIAGIALWTLTHYDLIDKSYVYYTSKLSLNIELLPKTEKFEFIKYVYEEEEKKEEKRIEIKPYDYQTAACEKFIEYYKNSDRGILSLPCGTGKTYTSYMISKNYNQIIIISPLKEFAKQNLKRYKEYGDDRETKLIDSDGTRDFDEIKEFIELNEKFVLSSTFKSVDIIKRCLEYFKNPLIIIDEFHNLSKNNIYPNENEEDNFNQILKSKNKFLFMSATPRIYELEDEGEAYDEELLGEIVYNMNFTYAIEKKYITDYTIWLPSIHEDNTKLEEELKIYEIEATIKAKCIYLFSCLLNTGSKKCIVYCKDTEEIKKFKKGIKKLNEYFELELETNKITSETKSKKRNEILNNFASGEKREILLSVRILDECIDIPTCDSIYITYPSKSKIRTIQRISRATRIDKNNMNKKANVFIWCDEYAEILDIISGIKEYDTMFKDKIKVNKINYYSDKKIENKVIEDKEYVKDYLVGIKEFKILTWEEKLDKVKEYMDVNGKRPSTIDKNERTKKLGSWLSNQMTNYNEDITECKYIMKNEEIKLMWEQFINDVKYKNYFLSNDDAWIKNLDNVKRYMNENSKRPSSHDKNEYTKKLGLWLYTQTQNYNEDISKCKQIMKNEEIKLMWEQFINDIKYKDYFISNEDVWIKNLEYVKRYINENSKRPSSEDKNENTKKLGRWLGTQIQNYNEDITECKNIMKNEEIKLMWEQFINDVKYKNYFLLNEDAWIEKLENVKRYINENSKRPSKEDKNENTKKLGKWLSHQITNYNEDTNKCKEIMKNEEIKLMWEQFINDIKYKNYFISNEDSWIENLENVKRYINENCKRPSDRDKNENAKKLGLWLSTQTKNYNEDITKCKYIMKNEEIKLMWEQFINDVKYKNYFISNEDMWIENLKNMKRYLNENCKRPSSHDKNENTKKLGIWLLNQIRNYNEDISKCKYIMKNEEIKLMWEQFINDVKYKNYFISNENEYIKNMNNEKL